MQSLTSVLRQRTLSTASSSLSRATYTASRTNVARHYTTARKEYTPASRAINFVLGTGIVIGGLVGISYGFDSRASIHKYVFLPLMHWTMDPETAHKVGIKFLKMGLSPWDTQPDDPALEVKVSAGTSEHRNATREQEGVVNNRQLTPLGILTCLFGIFPPLSWIYELWNT